MALEGCSSIASHPAPPVRLRLSLPGSSAAIAGGSVHPGDLKAAVRDAADGVLQRVRDAIAADKALAAAVKEVDKVAKRSAKGGGKKK